MNKPTDAAITDWSEWFFGGPYSWKNEDEWSKATWNPYVTTHPHVEDNRAYQGWLDFSWDIYLDAILYQRLPDPDLRMTRIFNYYIQKIHDGDWYDKETFAAWYEYHMGRSAASISGDKLKSEQSATVRYNLIQGRLRQAHNSHVTGKPTEPDKRLVSYLEDAIHRLAENPNVIFEVNGYYCQFPRPFEGLWQLWLLWDYASGGQGRYRTLPFYDEGAFPKGIDYSGNWDTCMPVNETHWKTGEPTNLVVLGYVLKVCEDAVERTIEGNKKKNAQTEANAQRKLEDGYFSKSGEEAVVGQTPYGHDHGVPFHTTYQDIFLFEVDGSGYAALMDLETPSGLVPVFEWDYEWPGQVAEPHALIGVSCPHCEVNWDWEHGVFRDYNGNTNFRDLPWIMLEDLDVLLPEEKPYPIILVPENQQALFTNEKLYEGVARTVEDVPQDEVAFLDGVVTLDEDGVLYCPDCHLKMSFGWHIDMSS